jgi:hypothetical protein
VTGKTTQEGPSVSTTGQDNASELISERIQQLGDWRGEKLAQVRKLIHEADPAIVEEWKWSTPVWSRDGIVCTGESYKQVIKLTFAKGAHLKDPKQLFNSSLEGNLRRAIDFAIDDKIDGPALKALFKEAIAFNQANTKSKPAARKAPAAKKKAREA